MPFLWLCRPVNTVARDGVQMLLPQKLFSNSIPSRAKRSRWGVSGRSSPQRYAEIAAHVKCPGKQQAGGRRRQQCFGHAAVTLLLDCEHRRQLAVRQQVAMGLSNLLPQRLSLSLRRQY